jgi:hypothetical protein
VDLKFAELLVTNRKDTTPRPLGLLKNTIERFPGQV